MSDLKVDCLLYTDNTVSFHCEIKILVFEGDE